jgi:uncharacterized repeat protein (TIGR03806 family)
MLITPRFALIALSAAVSALPVTACNGGGGTVGGPGRADTGPVPCPGTCLEASVVLGDASGPGPYPDPDAAPPDAAPPPPPPDVWPPPRPAAQTCTLPEIPPVGAFTTDVAFPALRFPRPIWFGYAPGDGARRYVVGQGGVVWVFEGRQDVEGAAVFLRLPVSRDHNEEGLLGLAFHPRYAENGRFFVYYSDPDGPERRTVLSAFTRADTPEATAASEQRLLLIPQPYGNHKGGSLLFGPDGYLYLGLGDGGSGGDPQNLAQNLESLLGKVLRLDVDLPDEECLTPYGIPADNPFAAGRCAPGAGPGRPEIFAVGVRNPWRMSFDRDTGLLWAGDVGQGEWEEVSVIRRGDNLGWRQVEGEVCYIAGCDPEAFVPPVWVYPHAEGKSITGGFVYRGRAFPELYGAYLYGDYDNGRIWALRVDERGRAENTLLVDTDDHITSFGEDPDGEIYVVTFSDGRAILALRRADAGPAPAPLPATLSQTGCFADVPGHVFAAGVVPYDLNSPLWSDGVDKRRGFALPDGQTARFAPDGHVDFPMGTVLLKTFAEPGGPPIETRLLVRQPRGWQGLTYRWRPDGTDADLLTTAETGEYTVAGAPLTWSFPYRAQCDFCHTQAAGGSLGPTHTQWDRTVTFGGPEKQQIDALIEDGYLDPTRPEPRPVPLPAPGDETAPAEARARGVLDANCAFCHRPDGPANATIDLRAATPFADTGLCDAEPGQGDFGVPGARLLAPGDPARSVLALRMRHRGDGQMPPLATTRVDAVGLAAVEAWIRGVGACP